MVGGAAFRLRAAAHAVKRCSLCGRFLHLLVLQQRRSTLNVRATSGLACRKARLAFKSTITLHVPACPRKLMSAIAPEKCNSPNEATFRGSIQGTWMSQVLASTNYAIPGHGWGIQAAGLHSKMKALPHQGMMHVVSQQARSQHQSHCASCPALLRSSRSSSAQQSLSWRPRSLGSA